MIKRYRITTAHTTVIRFERQPHDVTGLLDVLSDYRVHPFGQTTVDLLQLVKNDWYMSDDQVEVLAEYRLS